MSEDSQMSGVIYYMRHFSFPLSLTYEIMEMYTEVWIAQIQVSRYVSHEICPEYYNNSPIIQKKESCQT